MIYSNTNDEIINEHVEERTHPTMFHSYQSFRLPKTSIATKLFHVA
ncbi:hypothetical protein ACKLNO_05545 [Neisseriaceae bacterium B1]